MLQGFFSIPPQFANLQLSWAYNHVQFPLFSMQKARTTTCGPPLLLSEHQSCCSTPPGAKAIHLIFRTSWSQGDSYSPLKAEMVIILNPSLWFVFLKQNWCPMGPASWRVGCGIGTFWYPSHQLPGNGHIILPVGVTPPLLNLDYSVLKKGILKEWGVLRGSGNKDEFPTKGMGSLPKREVFFYKNSAFPESGQDSPTNHRGF